MAAETRSIGPSLPQRLNQRNSGGRKFHSKSIKNHGMARIPPPLPAPKVVIEHPVAENAAAAEALRNQLDAGAKRIGHGGGGFAPRGRGGYRQQGRNRNYSRLDDSASVAEESGVEGSGDTDTPGETNFTPPSPRPSSRNMVGNVVPYKQGYDVTITQTDTYVPPAVCLDPDLPPLAAEHPTRVWNAMLHALPSHLQPIVKWKYDEVDLGYTDEPGFVAHLTLLLPPTHPSISGHPLFKTLPKNCYTPEYLAAVEVLGGVKTWVGLAKRLKTDAQNHTLAMCIAENALAWVHAPIIAAVPQEDKSEECNAPTSLLKTLEEMMQKPTPIAVDMELEHDDTIDVFGCRLTVSCGAHRQIYVEECTHPTPAEAQDALLRRALDLNVLGFLEWLNSPADDGTDVETATEPSPETEVDWQAQLAYFCSSSGLPQPRYSQQVVRTSGQPTMFIGQVDVDGTALESSERLTNLKLARQDVARQAFNDHFGQDPVVLPHGFVL